MKKKPVSAPASPQTAHGTPLLSWKTPEYEYHEKSAVWKFGALFAVIALIVYGVLADSYPFAIVIALFAGVYFLLHKAPQEIQIEITDMGIKVEHRFYEYANIRNFWIIFKPGEVKTLNLRITKNVVKEISILLSDQDPAELREVLSRFVPELTGRDETFTEWVIRKSKL